MNYEQKKVSRKVLDKFVTRALRRENLNYVNGKLEAIPWNRFENAEDCVAKCEIGFIPTGSITDAAFEQ